MPDQEKKINKDILQKTHEFSKNIPETTTSLVQNKIFWRVVG